jgi:hypothetical protein
MSTIHPHKLRTALERHADISERKLRANHPKAASWFATHNIKPGSLRKHAARFISSAAIAGTMLLSNPLVSNVSSFDQQKTTHLPLGQLQDLFTANIQAILPSSVRSLSPDEEASLSRLIEVFWGIHATASLDDNHLNTAYGYIGAEQHLPRYPGDYVEAHERHIDAGITPGKGAWGYFAHSKNELTDDLIQKEKYYVAVQTLYLPDWKERLPYLRDWYKYRKVLVVNPKNGKTIVADVADAGPSQFTGKSFGGSPEVMAYLDMHDGAQRGAVLLFFVDDKHNDIPLGPVERSFATRRKESHE